MKTGLGWYRRKPVAFLGGVQGMSAREISVYAIVIDLIYQHGGGIHNDPKWIAGWFSDMGSAAVRATIESLVMRGKLFIDSDGFLSNKSAENELKTQQNLSENREKPGRKGGINSGKSRRAARDNKDIDEANAEADKIREEQIREEVSKDTKARTALDHLSEVVGIDLAKDFIAHRRALRKPMTAKAGQFMAEKLASMPDPGAAIRNSIERGWLGVFPPEVTPIHRKGKNYGERFDDAFNDLTARLAVQPFPTGN